MRISVVVLTQNRLASLKQCIARLDANRARNWELVVVDNGSTDGTREFLDEEKKTRGERLCVIRNDKGGSFAEARNLGARSASGDWVAFTDDDCAVASDWLERIRSAAREGLDAVGGLVLPMRPLAYPRWWSAELAWTVGLSTPGDFGKDAGRIYYPITSNLAFRREALLPKGFQEIGGVFGTLQVRYLTVREDSELWQRLRVGGYKTRFDPKMVVFHDIPQARLNAKAMLRRAYQDGRVYYTRQSKREFARYALRDWFAAPFELARVALRRRREFRRELARRSVWLSRQSGFLAGWLSDGSRWNNALEFGRIALPIGAEIVSNRLKPMLRRRLVASKKQKDIRRLPRELKHVLVVACGFVGDLVLIRALLDFLKSARPKMKVSLLSYPAARALFEDDRSVSEIAVISGPKEVSEERRRREVEAILARIRPDVALIAYYHRAPAAPLFRGLHCPTISFDRDVGFARQMYYEMASVRVNKDFALHEIQNLLRLAEPLGLSGSVRRIEMEPTAAGLREARELFEDHGLAPTPYAARQSKDELPGMPAVEQKLRPIALVPTAGEEAKEWPLEKWVELAERLESGGWGPLIFLGDMRIRSALERMLRARQLGAKNLCGSSLEGLFALVASCRLVIGPDSAPKHLAMASGVPTVTLYGSSEENRWRAMWDRKWHIELRACEVALSEEEKIGLAANHQVALISVDAAFEAAEKLLRKMK